MAVVEEVSTDQVDVDVVIIGAGFAGLYAMHKLRNDLGLTVRGFERASGVGGTWFWNRYPGARCDSESIIYGYSFSSELQQEWSWSERYAAQPEILKYLEHVAHRFDLARSFDFSTDVLGAEYDDERQAWLVRTNAGETVATRYLVTAVGCLASAPSRPIFDGLENFRGEVLYTSDWPHEGVDLTDKRVAIIGTGSSGVQTVPAIAPIVKHLTVFQRTANYSLPANNRPLPADEMAAVKRDYARINEACRWSEGGFHYRRGEHRALEVSPEERQRVYDELWRDGGQRFLFGSFRDLLINEAANETAAEYVRAHVVRTVRDRRTAETLTPRDHPFGTKRPLIDTNYYETFNRDNVDLVDLRSTPIARFEENSIVTGPDEIPIDVVIFATGFDAVTGPLTRLNLRGANGEALEETWAGGPRTYLGLAVHGFPNMFTITGPGSPAVLTNMPPAIEQHVDWIADCIMYMRSHEYTRIEATYAAEDEWAAEIGARAERTLYPKGNSWYLGANIPGKPRVFMLYVGSFGNYRRVCDEVATSGYRGFAFARATRSTTLQNA